MKIEKSKKSKDLNTMCVDVELSEYVKVRDEEEVLQLAEKYDFKKKRYFILGDGSNTIFTGDFEGLVIHVAINGKKIIEESEEYITIDAGAGENWDQFVRWSAKHELSGIENLAYIPGTVGAAPVQNIGAYGQAFENVFLQLEAINLYTGEKEIFTKEQCELRYRYSIFKEDHMDHYLVTTVRMQLSKIPQYDTNYHSRFSNESLVNWLKEEAEEPYKPIDVANAVTALRKYKLPEVDEYGTFGSAFVNPFVTVDKYKELAKIVPELQSYPVTEMDYSRKDWESIDEEEIVKIPAGRLLDELGWKGKWIGNVGTYDKHALCVVTNKEASTKEVQEYLKKMQDSVKKAYGIELRREIVFV